MEFRKKEIPAAITDNGKYAKYSLWRIGEESTTDKDFANTEKIEGKIIAECGGFCNLIKGE